MTPDLVPRGLLLGHVRELEAFELMGAPERPGVNRAQSNGRGQVRDGLLGVGVVADDEHVEGRAARFSGHEGVGEGGIERLDHAGAVRVGSDLLSRRRAGRRGQGIRGGAVDEVADVDHDLLSQLLTVAAADALDRAYREASTDDPDAISSA
jgi:hypothetical protein